MSGITTPKGSRGTMLSDYKAVVRRKEADPDLSTNAAIRLVAKRRGKTPGAVGQAYYKTVKALNAQALPQQEIATKPKAARKSDPQSAAVSVKRSLAGTMKAINALEKQNETLLKKCESLEQQNAALKSRLAAIKAAL